jgi:outer membrane lipoprotein carrier protein
MNRKRILSLAILVGVAALSVTSTGGEAQERVSARTVAARVQSFYDQTGTYEATFYQTYYNKLYNRYDRSHGRLAFDKPGRMRFDYARPNGKVIVANGDRLTMWEPGDSGSAGQYAQTDTARAAIPGAFSFLLGNGRLEEDYTFRLLSGSGYGWSGHVLELRPRRADPRYRRVLLFVDAHRDRLGVVHTIRIDDHDGNRNKFQLRSMRFNRDIASSRFAFAPPAGARRISM